MAICLKPEMPRNVENANAHSADKEIGTVGVVEPIKSYDRLP